MTIAAALILLLLPGAVPPLSDAQRAQLDDAVDRGYVDEPALYPLLENALTWPADDEVGAVVPDYKTIYQQPATERGKLFLIEGVLLRTRRLELTQRGDWGDAVTELALKAPGQDEAVVVLLADPQNRWSINARSQSVRVAARFYKIWSDTDQHGQATNYLLFIAHQPKIAAIDNPAAAPRNGIFITLAILTLLLFLWSYFRGKARHGAVRTRTSGRSSQETAELLQESEHLPADPADALAEMDNRHQRDDADN
ncbi:MAG: hypothetical protein IT445_07825 [Phycisphaeraceae bacterium]|nr:hypothetical protein [Phycisphaeraceae bacterium]